MIWTMAEVREKISGFDVSTEVGQLIFADWLEEQGQKDWAFLCRVYRDSNPKRGEFQSVFPVWLTWSKVDYPDGEIRICVARNLEP